MGRFNDLMVERRAPPPELSGMASISSGTLWLDAVEALHAAGFSILWSKRWKERDWRGVEPVDDSKWTDLLLLEHPLGLIVSMSSSQGGMLRARGEATPSWGAWGKPKCDEVIDIEDLTLSYQINLGSGLAISQGARIGGSNSGSYLGDGTMILRGYDSISRVALGQMIAEICAAGELIPVKDWSRDFFHVDQRLFEDNASSRDSIGQEVGSIKREFGERHRCGFKKFIEALPAHIGRIVDGAGEVIPMLKADRPARTTSRQDSFNGWLSKRWVKRALPRPSPAESLLCKAWSDSVDELFCGAGPLSLDVVSKLSCGATHLHALAHVGASHESSLEIFLGRLAQSSNAKALAGCVDGFGQTPAGSALSCALEIRAMGALAERLAMFEGLCKLGWGPAPGEVVRVMLQSLRGLRESHARGEGCEECLELLRSFAQSDPEWLDKAVGPDGQAMASIDAACELARLLSAGKSSWLGSWLEGSDLESACREISPSVGASLRI